MSNYWLAGAAALVMMTGSAMAQTASTDTTTSTQTTTSTGAPVSTGSYSYKTSKTVNSDGTEVDKGQSYVSGSNGTKSSASSTTTAPDGSVVNSSHVERTTSPGGDVTSTSRITTTTGQ